MNNNEQMLPPEDASPLKKHHLLVSPPDLNQCNSRNTDKPQSKKKKSNFSLKCRGKFCSAFGELAISVHLLRSVSAAVGLGSLLVLASRHSTAETALS